MSAEDADTRQCQRCVALDIEVPLRLPSRAIALLLVYLLEECPVGIVHGGHGDVYLLVEEVVGACRCLAILFDAVARSGGLGVEIAVGTIAWFVRIDDGATHAAPFYLCDAAHVRGHEQIVAAILRLLDGELCLVGVLSASREAAHVLHRGHQLAVGLVRSAIDVRNEPHTVGPCLRARVAFAVVAYGPFYGDGAGCLKIRRLLRVFTVCIDSYHMEVGQNMYREVHGVAGQLLIAVAGHHLPLVALLVLTEVLRCIAQLCNACCHGSGGTLVGSVPEVDIVDGIADLVPFEGDRRCLQGGTIGWLEVGKQTFERRLHRDGMRQVHEGTSLILRAYIINKVALLVAGACDGHGGNIARSLSGVA